MVAFKVNNKYLKLDPKTTIGVTSVNPILQPGTMPGELILSIKFPIIKENQIVFGFQEKLAINGRKNTWENVECYLHNILWKKGTLKLRNIGTDYEMSFHAGNGELQLALENKTMPSLNLGSEAANYAFGDYPTQNHLFFPIKNPDFYKGNNNDYAGYVNYYHNGSFKANTTINEHTRVPFPYLLYILNKTFIELGYFGLTGSWINEPDIKKVIIYNNYSLDLTNGGGLNVFSATVDYNRHIPDISIGDFLIDVAIFFGVVFIPNKKTGFVKVVKIKDVLNSTPQTDAIKTSLAVNFKPNSADGYYFVQEGDTADLTLEKNKDWLTLQQGNRKEVIGTRASTVNVISETDAINNTREWTVPNVQQPGVSAAFELGIDNRAPLRFMVYNGIQQDNLGNDYPQGSYATPTMSLRWEGANGLVAQNYEEWIAFKDKTILVERELRMNIIDFLTLDITQKVFVDKLIYLFGKISARISFSNGIGAVKATMHKIDY